MRVLLADDEVPARERLRALLAQLPVAATVIECGDGADAVNILLGRDVDLALLDVQMPELDGIEVVRAVGPARMPPAIFVTAHDRYAVAAFEVRAVDYLLKPFDEHRLRQAVTRALRANQSPDERERMFSALLDQRPAPKWLDRLAVRQNRRILVVPLSEVAWLSAADNYVTLHTFDRKAWLVRGKLTALEARLDPASFVRVHRSALVNLAHVVEVVPLFRGDQQLVLRSGEEVAVSRTHRATLLQKLGLVGHHDGST